MLIAFLRKILLTLITLLILSLISYHILQRSPSYQIEEGGIAYVDYVTGLLHGDFGFSYTQGEPLAKQILREFPATLLLCLSATLLSLILGIPLGFFAATQQHNLVGKWLKTLGSLSLAVPVFWLAIVLSADPTHYGWSASSIRELVVDYDVEVITGVKSVDIFLYDNPYRMQVLENVLKNITLPTLILAIPATLEIMRITQQRTEYVLKQNYVKVARTRGWSPFKVWRHHIIRNTLPPLIPMIARNVTLIFAFAMLIENVVSWNGVGYWIIHALASKDYQAISAGVMAIGLFVLIVDLIASLFTTLLDPSQKKDWYVSVR